MGRSQHLEALGHSDVRHERPRREPLLTTALQEGDKTEATEDGFTGAGREFEQGLCLESMVDEQPSSGSRPGQAATPGVGSEAPCPATLIYRRVAAAVASGRALAGERWARQWFRVATKMVIIRA